MLLKRIEAKTLPEAIDRVRAECGADALVVETRPTRDGFLVVASKPEAQAPRRDQAGTTSFLSKWTRGFRPLAEKATDFGLSKPILQAVERALLGTKVELSKAGDPGLPGLASRVLAALVQESGSSEYSGGPPDDAALAGVAWVACRYVELPVGDAANAAVGAPGGPLGRAIAAIVRDLCAGGAGRAFAEPAPPCCATRSSLRCPP